MLRHFLRRAGGELQLRRILEVGCGSGGDLRFLSGFAPVTGVERSPILAERARRRGDAAEILLGDFLEVSPPGRYDLTCLFDVIEHIEDDDGFLQNLGRVIQPGQLLLLSVPAVPWLYGPHDEMLNHYRRYSRAGMNALLERNGYEILEGSYFLFLLFPLLLLTRWKDMLLARLGRRPRAPSYGVLPRPLNALLRGVLDFEAALAGRFGVPIGAWYIVLARRGLA